MQNEIIIFYKYTEVTRLEEFAQWTKKFASSNLALPNSAGLKGRVIIATEGINGTLEGTTEEIAAYEEALRTCEYGDFGDVWFKHSPGTTDQSAFPKLWVRVRSEIVALKLPEGEDVDPRTTTGTHIEPETLKQWIDSGDDISIIDMRNGYEYDLGHFKNSIDPRMDSFYELPNIAEKLDHLKNKKVITVCTYGVRCEKASGFLKLRGFNDVYQLHGGIGSYMKKYPGQDFEGSLYVFDNRLAEQFTHDYVVVGRCFHCDSPSELYRNCSNNSCHRHMLVCEPCHERTAGICGECIEKHAVVQS
jgi:UPF0176 protein